MKKFTSLSFLLVAALLIFTSCSKDDEAPALDVKILEGSWNFTSSESTMNGESFGMVDEEATYEFMSDKTLVITEGGFTTEGTYSTSGQTITTVIDGDTQKYDVNELTASKFTVSQTVKMDLGAFEMITVTTNYFTK